MLFCELKCRSRQTRGTAVWITTFWTSALLASPTNAFDQSLLSRAASVRQKIPSCPTADQLYHPSSYERRNGKHRGFCNWIIPNRVMLGQYPGQNPERDGPSLQAVEAHMDAMVIGEGINAFCSLQSELPPQNDFDEWSECDGQVFLEEYLRREFPKPFTHYASMALSRDPGCRFIHNPIEDLSVPKDTKSLQKLLSTLLEILDDDDDCRVYIHCWGGRGRAGLVGSCLLSLIWPELDSRQILDLVQEGYSSRNGAQDMPFGLKRSPQTETQRRFVKQFVQECKQAYSKRK